MSADLEEQSRCMLRLVIGSSVSTIQAVCPVRPETCPNCDAINLSEKSPYCGPKCRELAGFVRQVRAAMASGAIHDLERQTALGQVLWSLLGGGYPLRVELVQARVKEQVLQRAEGRCEACAAPATEIDHAKTACNRPINLRAVCKDCSKTRPFGDPGIINANPLIEEIALRSGAPAPVRCCDDPQDWNWREYLNLRKNAAVPQRNVLT